MRSKQLIGWGFLSPTILVIVLIGVFPFIYVVGLSLYEYNVFSVKGWIFVGLDNFKNLVFDPRFQDSLSKTLIFVAVTCGIQLPLGLGLAMLLNQEFVGKGFFRTILVLPLSMAPVAIGSMWILITRPYVGPISYWLNTIGFTYNISENALQSFLTTVAMDVWHWTPFVTLTFLAGLTSIPVELEEAARVDGAGRWQILRHVLIPLLTPVLATTLFIRIMDALRIYDEVWTLTAGGPGTATRYVNIYLVRTTLAQNDYGYGATMSVFLLFLTVILCNVLLSLMSKAREVVR
ncbi:ABC transporter permease subunit [candidate division KSB3 bacterium]|uniref:ABC transporter permease subunit n=1 Tax=candidate division KSB3 bacterium TaxID=2044937 RepID=A0A9D5JUF5_9BACT|nr:ABC transporter permease subunit [candidate division KSB3 bacterium]MBD3324310.1 ABC transporter permease subunit [candidate division KSB3 bacterium]